MILSSLLEMAKALMRSNIIWRRRKTMENPLRNPKILFEKRKIKFEKNSFTYYAINVGQVRS